MTDEQSTAPNTEQTDSSINRREYAAALSAAAVGSLAGCQSGPSGEGTDTASPSGDETDGAGGEGSPTDTQELGERVPQLQLGYSAGLGDTTQMHESSVPIIRSGLESIGVTSQVKPVEFLTLWNNFYSDKRNVHAYGSSGLGSPYADPLDIIETDHIRTAGANAFATSHWANCEATMLIEELGGATSREEQKRITQDFMEIHSEALTDLPLFTRVGFGGYRTDVIEEITPGFGGLRRMNSDFIFSIETAGDSVITINTDNATLFSNNPTLSVNNVGKRWWDPIFYDQLLRYDENFELYGGLAANWESANDFQTITFELREDALFHNGEPITAEDVKWTFEYIQDNVGVFQAASPWPYESINAVDEHTVEFNFTTPTISWVDTAAATWGILPKDVWVDAGAEEDPKNVDLPMDPYVGSGPYKLTDFEAGRFMRGQPFENHYKNPSAPLELQGFQDQQSMARAFRQGGLNVFVDMAPVIAEDLREVDQGKVITAGSRAYVFYNMHNAWGPTKFKEFRHAWSWSLNRKQMTELATFGNAEPVLYHAPNGLLDPHRVYPDDPDELLTKVGVPEGDSERARQILRDAGWGWDDQDRLHYPPDADLDPLWPKGESPRHYPEKWPCVEELGLTPQGGDGGS